MLLPNAFKKSEKLCSISRNLLTFHDFPDQVQTKLFLQTSMPFIYHETSFLLSNLANNFSGLLKFYFQKKLDNTNLCRQNATSGVLDLLMQSNIRVRE